MILLNFNRLVEMIRRKFLRLKNARQKQFLWLSEKIQTSKAARKTQNCKSIEFKFENCCFFWEISTPSKVFWIRPCRYIYEKYIVSEIFCMGKLNRDQKSKLGLTKDIRYREKICVS
eukprot:TRINITY_DN5310_c1_g2_i2.p2 TRINITY_DN5310_c1_g2~~TRINITY_DN5310_c1_g2_i2.p2  ORF type:complete len:117 (-),score=2.21 TRINITY_DN5310_c1_g2_i2:454-804(-)